MLLYDGSGKDKISDLTVNLIKEFLCEYTETFSLKYIYAEFLGKFPVDNAYFNYETESFVSKEYVLPYIYNEKGRKEFVLLTPYDILREDEPSINRKDFYDSYERICTANQRRNRRATREKSIRKIEKLLSEN